MRILVLGGTQFVGRHIVEALVSGGHSVSILTRGRTADGLPAMVERLRGDRNGGAEGLAAVAGRTWGACVDVSGYTPAQVRPSVALLRGRVGRYVFVSAVSVYGDPPCGPVDEKHPRMLPAGPNVTEIDARTYGPLKVACEDVVADAFGDSCAVLRPQIVAGPYDPLDRFSYWVRRVARGGVMLAPGDGSDYVQVIDARDVGRFVQTACERELAGSFNLAGPRLTWAEFLWSLGASAMVWVPSDVLRAAGVTESELPLYRRDGGPRSALMHVDNARAVRAGLTLTDPRVTAADTRAWLDGADLPSALPPEREAALIEFARGHGNVPVIDPGILKRHGE